jgi:hypothetical protein
MFKVYQLLQILDLAAAEAELVLDVQLEAE